MAPPFGRIYVLLFPSISSESKLSFFLNLCDIFPQNRIRKYPISQNTHLSRYFWIQRVGDDYRTPWMFNSKKPRKKNQWWQIITTKLPAGNGHPKKNGGEFRIRESGPHFLPERLRFWDLFLGSFAQNDGFKGQLGVPLTMYPWYL